MLVGAVLFCLACFTGVLLYRAGRAPAGKVTAGQDDVPMPEQAVAHLQGALRIKTVSHSEREKIDQSQFEAFRTYLEQSYPNVHRAMERRVMEDGSLLYRWPGRDSSLEPIGFLAHMDVVPAGEEATWSHPPFGGEIEDGYLYGRGAIDMKGQLIALLEAAESLLENSFSPTRDVYFIFGCDEELADNHGAADICAYLKQKGVRFALILDEGSVIKSGTPYGIEGDIAYVGVCEKGYIDLELVATQPGGHASVPPPHTALGEVCRAVTQIERHPFPAEWNPVTRAMFDALAPHMPFGKRFFYANRFLFGWWLKRNLLKTPENAALFRTTCAATMAEGSRAANILPAKATATLNLRTAPEKSSREEISRVAGLCGEHVQVRVIQSLDPSPLSQTRGETYERLCRTISACLPVRAVAPCPVVVGTDSRFFHEISEHVYRFVPFPCMKEESVRMHAADERIELESFGLGIAFFRRLIQNMNGE